MIIRIAHNFYFFPSCNMRWQLKFLSWASPAARRQLRKVRSIFNIYTWDSDLFYFFHRFLNLCLALVCRRVLIKKSLKIMNWIKQILIPNIKIKTSAHFPQLPSGSWRSYAKKFQLSPHIAARKEIKVVDNSYDFNWKLDLL